MDIMIQEKHTDFSEFSGFKTVSHLRNNLHLIPKVPGVYLVFRNDTDNPKFLTVGSGGHFKDREPNVPLNELSANWVEDASVVYIGKAGSLTGSATLLSRIKQLLQFGDGKNIGHWGGRLLWQLADHEELVIAWKEITDQEPKAVETVMIQEFKDYFGQRPFANLQG